MPSEKLGTFDERTAMKVLKSHNSAWFDVDDTLVKWGTVLPEDREHLVPITCPVSSVEDEDGNIKEVSQWTEYLRPHKKHIEQLKLHKARGHTVIVWSQGGWEWAEAVVKALKLENYVDLVVSKPNWYYDDIPCQEYMGKNIWYEDK